MTHADAVAFAADWAEAWNRLDIDAVAGHFASDAVMTSPLAARVLGSAVVTGREAIRAYWHRAYVDVTAPMLELEGVTWDERTSRLVVWWRAALPSGSTRACETMDFGPHGLIVRSEAYYGAAAG